jgi:uncharacterized protein (TIGR02145 family)
MVRLRNIVESSRRFVDEATLILKELELARAKQVEEELGMSKSEADETRFRGIGEGLKMKSTASWDNNINGTNSSGFSGLPSGGRGCDGTFYNLGNTGSWWSSTECSALYGSAWYRYLDDTKDNIYRGDEAMELGFSVRCLKD